MSREDEGETYDASDHEPVPPVDVTKLWEAELARAIATGFIKPDVADG